jgi:glutamate-1-semialdehyde 2,1-aminomutase
VGSILTAFFINEPVMDYESAKRADTKLFGRFFQQLLAEGIYWPPSQFEAAFVSASHSNQDIEITVKAARKALHCLACVL